MMIEIIFSLLGGFLFGNWFCLAFVIPFIDQLSKGSIDNMIPDRKENDAK